MLAQRIALLAERLGIPLPRIAGQTSLGLAGTIRAVRPVPLVITERAELKIAEMAPDLCWGAVIEFLNRSHVWTWLETRGRDGCWHWPQMGEEPEALVRCSEGDLRFDDFVVILSTSRCSLVCVPGDAGGKLTVVDALKPRRAPVPCARLLVGKFVGTSDPTFDSNALCTLIASQTRLRVRIDPRDLEREAADEREFITGVRRYLEALRNHALSSVPRAKYELVDRSPLRVRTFDGQPWARAFTRPGTLLQLPTSGQIRTLPILDVSDDGDTITLEGDDDGAGVLEQGELKVRAGDDPLRRMREALDAIAMRTDEAHGRLLEALTRPESLQDVASLRTHPQNEEPSRQAEAKALALQTPDIALIHGPPGTGKTTVICGIVEELVQRGQRVLLVAPTHVALDNVLERVGDRAGVTAIRLGSADNVEEQAHRFLLKNRSKDLTRNLANDLGVATSDVPSDDPVAAVQREWARRIANDDEVGTLLLLNANLVCATPIGIAMAREFRDVEVVFDVMILDEASKATITDFLVPAARARKWILVGDHRQLAPYVDLGELEAVVSERVKRAGLAEPDAVWVRELSTRLRQHFDIRMHPDPQRVANAWRDLVFDLTSQFEIDDATFDELVALQDDPEKWRDAHRAASHSNTEGDRGDRATVLRLGAELLELQALALPSVFEHLTRLPASRAVRLNLQHRMAPALALFSSELVYGGDYPSAPETAKLGLDIPSLEAPAIWIDTAYAPAARRYEHPRDRDWKGGDYINPLEVDVALELVEVCATWAVQSWRGDVRDRGRGPDATFEIGVVSFYLKQALQLRDAIFRKLPGGTDPWRRRWSSPAANGAPIDIHVSIVDRFQGREKDVIVLCTTRSNPKGRRGHVDNLNRLNVAVTRARHKRIVIGDSTTLAGQEGGRRRQPGDLLVRLYETSEHKKKWGRALGGRS